MEDGVDKRRMMPAIDKLLKAVICSVMFRAGLFKEVPEWYYTSQFGDWELHIINSRHGKRGYINEVMGYTPYLQLAAKRQTIQNAFKII